jgi:hypothetical protein
MQHYFPNTDIFVAATISHLIYFLIVGFLSLIFYTHLILKKVTHKKVMIWLHRSRTDRISLFCREWLLEFLERDGLGVLLESLNRLGDRRVHSVADTLNQMQCISCLRTVMNFRPGLQYIVDRNEYTRKLATGK